MKEKMSKILKTPLVIKQQMKINSLENKIETLENTIKNDLYKEFMKKLDDSGRCDRLVSENKRLKRRIKTLKELLKEED